MNIIENFLTWFRNVRCDRCGCLTPKDKTVTWSAWGDWGYECISCATDSGLLKQTQERKAAQQHRLERRKEFGL